MLNSHLIIMPIWIVHIAILVINKIQQIYITQNNGNIYNIIITLLPIYLYLLYSVYVRGHILVKKFQI